MDLPVLIFAILKYLCFILGCGKTLIARAVAKSAHARFIQLDLSTLTDKWYGESQSKF
jgi:SpoVK/Ycf46/Vps4 family AAA+-type ATPase